MTQGQVMAAKVVIGKSIPDLKAIEHSGNPEKPVQRRMIVEFVAPKRYEVRAKFRGQRLRFFLVIDSPYRRSVIASEMWPRP